MRNLQLLVPHQECIFHCPFCISKTHAHENRFYNLYQQNYSRWKKNLERLLTEYPDLKTVIITGTSEPLLDVECVSKMIDIIKCKRNDIQIEIQTRYYQKTLVSDQVDVLAYSIADDSLLWKPYLAKTKIRYVILLTKSFEKYSLSSLLKRIPKQVSQVTFKVLQDSKGYQPQLDLWIKENGMSEEKKQQLQQEIASYRGDISIRYDENCMNSENRYMIFREDGQLYLNWESEEPISSVLLF